MLSVFCKLKHHADMKYGCLPHKGEQDTVFCPALGSLLSFKDGHSHWVECSLPISCLSLQRELALWTTSPLPVGKVLRRQMLCFWHHYQNLSRFAEKSPPLSLLLTRNWHLFSQAALALPLHSHPGGGSSDTHWDLQQENPLISSLPACLSFSPLLPIWPMKVFRGQEKTNDGERRIQWMCGSIFSEFAVLPGTLWLASNFLGEFSDRPVWLLFFILAGWVHSSIIHPHRSGLGSAFSLWPCSPLK